LTLPNPKGTGSVNGLDPTQFPAPGNAGPLSLIFDHPVQAAGTQIAIDDTFNFQASVAAFDHQNALLGTFTVNATASLALDNSAVFLGVQSDQPNIAKLVYRSSVSARAIGINQLSLRQVPEPTPILGCLILGISRIAGQRKRSQQ
jgi:hypothetical protein